MPDPFPPLAPAPAAPPVDAAVPAVAVVAAQPPTPAVPMPEVAAQGVLASRDVLCRAAVQRGIPAIACPKGERIELALPPRAAVAITATAEPDSWARAHGERPGTERALDAAKRPGPTLDSNGIGGLIFPLISPQVAERTGLPTAVLGTLQAGFAVGGVVEAVRAGARWLDGGPSPTGPSVQVSVMPSSEGGMITVGGQF